MTSARCVTLCILLTACADEWGPATSDFATVRDSAGIVIVQNHTAEWTLREGWRVSPTPILEIPDSALLGEGRYVIAGARLASGGIVALTDAGGRLFGGDGAFQRPFARRGDGPGEFRYARDLIVRPGDSIVVATMGKRGWFAPDGAFVRDEFVDQERLRTLGRWGECANRTLPDLSWIGCQDDPTIPTSATNRPSRVNADGWRSPGPGLLRRLNRLLLVPPSPDTAYRLGVDIGIEQQGIDNGTSGGTFVVHPFHARSALAAGGTPLRIASAMNPHWEIEVWSVTGTLERIIRLDGGRRAPTAAERSVADSILRAPGSDIDAPDPVLRERMLKAIITPDSLPGHTQLLMTPDGEILSRQWSHFAAAPSVFDVFTAEGRWLGPLRFLPRFRVLEVGRDYVLGIQYDEDDVPTLQLFGLER
ncbi:MAG TPA: hypothetical protein VFN90_04525 [Gemmatimonadales bacterium]|nr:hypothetical protein [Gemmatimonadales bacterium]